MGAASHLHDVDEDTDISIDFYTKEAYPDLVRADRKAREHMRLKGVSYRAKQIKLCDRLDNLRDMELHTKRDLSFADLYARETMDLLEHIMPEDIGPGNVTLQLLAAAVMQEVSRIRVFLKS
jgi:(p)ppGpp synthase/HD superfamily hydrolase